MTEKELIAKIQELRQIKPREEWVLLTKKQILENKEKKLNFSLFFDFIKGIQKGEKFIFQHKPAFASLLIFAVLIGLFGFAQNSLPGDFLFPVKKITEKSQAVFLSEIEKQKHNLQLANKRLEDITKIAQSNSVENLAPAINEFKTSVQKAAQSVARIKDPKAMKDIALEIKKLEEKTEEAKTLGVELGTEQELDNVKERLVSREIEDLEKRSLTEKQKEILKKAKESFEKKDYSQALEEILKIN